MAKPSRNTNPGDIQKGTRTFFVSSKTNLEWPLLRTEPMANLFIDVLRVYVAAKRFRIHDFVVMPDHLHVLITVDSEMSIERSMQFIKGGFSYRLGKELGHRGEVWQRGFSEVRVEDRESFLKHREYIAQNPVRAGLSETPEIYPYCYAYLASKKRAGAKAQQISNACGTAEAVP